MSYNSSHLCLSSINFSSISEEKTSNTRCQQILEVWWRRRKTVHIIGIEQVQTGSDSFRHVKHSRSATATERNWDVMETFLSVWTSPFNYTWENFIERWRSATERKRESAVMWTSVVQPDVQQMTTERMRITRWIPKAINTLWENVIFIAILHQQ